MGNTSANRCERCNRPLKDARAQYGWRCAEILGVTQMLNEADDATWESFIAGAERAGANLEKMSKLGYNSGADDTGYIGYQIAMQLALDEGDFGGAERYLKLANAALEGEAEASEIALSLESVLNIGNDILSDFKNIDGSLYVNVFDIFGVYGFELQPYGNVAYIAVKTNSGMGYTNKLTFIYNARNGKIYFNRSTYITVTEKLISQKYDSVSVEDGYVNLGSLQKAMASFGYRKDNIYILNTTNYNYSLNEVLNIQTGLKEKPQIYDSNKKRFVNATKDQTLKNLNPMNFAENSYQFLDLTASLGLSANDADNYLKGNGTLEGMGSTYTDAAQKYNVSEAYLIGHSILETGHGKSELARGVVVNGVTVYNMYGINANDNDPIRLGAEYAYKMGWTTPELAIAGGAKWISENYLNNGQKTLYEMRWNPENPGVHQYATAVNWASAQESDLKKIYEPFVKNKDYILTFHYPVYGK